MDRLGIIGGSAFLDGHSPGGQESRISTTRGDVVVHESERWVYLSRHGEEGYRPPHRIPHHAHVLALESLGIRRVVGLCSVGSLDPRIRPGTVIVPEDYLSFHAPPTFCGDERLHIVPHLDRPLRLRLLEAARTVADALHVEEHSAQSGRRDAIDGGVYAETRGPRFETRAEVRLLADYADVVGMTAASEATLLQERGMAYAILGMVDNFAHGIGASPLSMEAFDAQLEANRHRARGLLDRLIASLDEPGAEAGEVP